MEEYKYYCLIPLGFFCVIGIAYAISSSVANKKQLNPLEEKGNINDNGFNSVGTKEDVDSNLNLSKEMSEIDSLEKEDIDNYESDIIVKTENIDSCLENSSREMSIINIIENTTGLGC